MKPREIRLSTTPSAEDIAALRLGDIVYLDGLIYTACGNRRASVCPSIACIAV